MIGINTLPPIDTRALFLPERRLLLDLLARLSDDQWQLPTVCDGWTVHDVALHLLWVDLSNISRRRDRYFGRPQDTPGDLSDLSTLIAFVNQLNDNWITGARRLSPQMVQILLELTGREWSEYVQTVDILAMGDGVGWAGPGPAPVWLDVAREFTERWVHQQHIRDAVGIPGATEPMFLQPVLATFAMALPHALRDAQAPTDATVQLVISGDSGGTWTAGLAPDGWSFVEPDDQPATASVTIDQDTAWRLFTRGISPNQARAAAGIQGDEALAERVFSMVTILA